MNFYALFPTLISIIILSLGIFVFVKNSKIKTNEKFLVLCCLFSLWFLSLVFICWENNNNLFSLLLSKLALLGMIFVPVIFFHIVLLFLQNQLSKYIKYLYVFSFFLFFTDFLTGLFFKDLYLNSWGYFPFARKIFIFLIVQLFSLAILSIFLLYKNLKKLQFSSIKKEQIKYFIFASFMLAFCSIDYFAAIGISQLYPVSYIFALLMVVNISYCMVRKFLISFKLFFIQSIVLILLYSFVLGVPFVIGKQTNNWFLSAMVLLLISLTGPYLFEVFKTKIEDFILAEQIKYQQFLLKNIKEIFKYQEISKLSRLIVRIITKELKVSFAALFVYNEEKKYYRCLSRRGDYLKNKDIKFTKDSEIIQYIKKESEPFLLFNSVEKNRKFFDVIHDDISLVIPIVNLKDVVAFVVLGDKSDGSLYSKKDLDCFKLLSYEVCIAITNCIFFDKVFYWQKQLFEAEKLAIIGKMADGFANQLKNRLNQFYLVGEGLNYELGGFKNSSENFIKQEEYVDTMLSYIGQMADSMVDDVKKTNNVLQDILNFSKISETNEKMSKLSLSHVIEDSLKLLKIKYHKDKIPLSLHLPEKDYIYGFKSQIKKVFFNCLNNAYDAIIEKQLYIKKTKSKFNGQDYNPQIIIELKYVDKKAKIYIQDNGMGVKPEYEDKIFFAFFTTKGIAEKNSGMGLYVVKKIITEHHKGSIRFKSKYGFGSTFLITLPLNKNA